MLPFEQIARGARNGWGGQAMKIMVLLMLIGIIVAFARTPSRTPARDAAPVPRRSLPA
jgi:hypothetical protein